MQVTHITHISYTKHENSTCINVTDIVPLTYFYTKYLFSVNIFNTTKKMTPNKISKLPEKIAR